MDRISSAVSTGAVPQSRMIELRNEAERQTALAKSARQELVTRGFSPEQLRQIESGDFVSTIDVMAPLVSIKKNSSRAANEETMKESTPFAYEIQSLAVELGEQVQSGQY